MEAKAARMRSSEAPRSSPALHFVRPLLIAAAVLAGLGARPPRIGLLVAAGALILVSALLLVVLHTSYRRRREERSGIRCG
jgi:hypothetical protein